MEVRRPRRADEMWAAAGGQKRLRQTLWRSSGRKSEPEGGGEVVSHDPHSPPGAAGRDDLTVTFCFSSGDSQL